MFGNLTPSYRHVHSKEKACVAPISMEMFASFSRLPYFYRFLSLRDNIRFTVGYKIYFITVPSVITEKLVLWVFVFNSIYDYSCYLNEALQHDV